MNQSRNQGVEYTSVFGFFSLNHPESWLSEEEEECTIFYRKHDGVGALQISAYEAENLQSSGNVVREYLDSMGTGCELEESVLEHGEKMVEFSNQDNEAFSYKAFVMKGRIVVYATYFCEIESIGVEKTEVRSILKSVKIHNKTESMTAK